jgi:hypothetical protein
MGAAPRCREVGIRIRPKNVLVVRCKLGVLTGHEQLTPTWPVEGSAVSLMYVLPVELSRAVTSDCLQVERGND